MGIGVVSTGLLFFALGVYFGKMVFFVSGISLVVIGLGLISRRWIGDRLAFSIVGLLVLFLWVLPSDWFPNYSVDVEMFIASGLFLVFSSLMLIMFNSELIVKGIIFLFSKFKTGRAVLKTAFRYSLHSKFRTGMMIAIFALVIFTITTMSMIVGILGANIENQVEKASGGYDIIGICNENSPVTDIREEIKNMVLNEKIKRISSPLSKRIALNLSSSQDGKKYYMVIGVDDEFIEGNQFEFIKLLPEYKNKMGAWEAIRNNDSLVIVDASVLEEQAENPFKVFTADVGDIIGLFDKNNEVVEKKIIGVLDTSFIQGVFSYKNFVREEFNVTVSNYFLFSVKKNVNVDDVAKSLERKFLKNGMQTIPIKTRVLEGLKTMNDFFDLFTAYMALGLLIGVSGLGIITMRTVHERKQEIGMMRAIGFKRRMVLTSFLIEFSMISLLGIIVGTILGVFTGYLIWRDQFQSLNFVFFINWQPILVVFAAAFIFTLISVFPASRGASRMSPVEALRYKE